MIQRIVIVWLWYQTNVGFPPSKTELMSMIGVGKFGWIDFGVAYKILVEKVFLEYKRKELVNVDELPKVNFNIVEQLNKCN